MSDRNIHIKLFGSQNIKLCCARKERFYWNTFCVRYTLQYYMCTKYLL